MAYMEKVIYGGTTMFRVKCPKCGLKSLTNDGVLICDCGGGTHGERYQRTIIEATARRRVGGPTKTLKEKLKEEQNHRCYWCGRRMGTPYYKGESLRYLRPNYDHKVPFAYEQRNRDENWCLSCNVCNQFKSSKLFKDEEACKEYVRGKWELKIRRGQIELQE